MMTTKLSSFLFLFCVLHLSAARTTQRDFSPLHVTQTLQTEFGTENWILPPAHRDHPSSEDWKQLMPSNGDPAQMLPIYVGTLRVGQNLTWSESCFRKSEGWIDSFTGDGLSWSFQLNDAKSTFCTDLYVFATSQRVIVHDFLFHGVHHFNFKGWKSPEEMNDVKYDGLRVFYFKNGVVSTLVEAFRFYELLFGHQTEAALANFLKKDLGWTPVLRQDTLLDIPEDQIQSGDVFFLFRMCGLEMDIVVMSGSHAAHTAVALRYPDGHVYIHESTDHSDAPPGSDLPPPYGIKKTLWSTWIHNYHQYNYTVVWAKLRPELRNNFNTEAALGYFKTVEGLPFGYPNFGFGAIDTPSDNLPPPLNNETMWVAVQMLEMAGSFLPKQMLIDGLNMRLKHGYGIETSCSTIKCIMSLAEDNGLSISEVAAYPEQDKWIYPDGHPSIVCDVLVLRILCAGGAFDQDWCDNVNTAEFTPRDVYSLKIWDLGWDRPAACKELDLPWCQVAGRWVMDMPQFNTIAPYKHMNEHCAGRAPAFSRIPEFC
ncbi:putative Inositol-1; 4; 5-trisphosphate 5-phosphatase 4 [Paratrimastix pyriformis]|uniref:Inositol-1 n=1 Tax=Paratrimastix pyriformis TaxID=342808 RepID=A0ABQ8UIH2_9EUKA|nr:putative Inositol-1; 4; 5-trisphosphate 5-phosphatase 4 [Paratrimastix pyriformis]|eukprot:GAFH01001251.1.p1 GENE.GAFH01001251.1~~GAFH01001251.1.p1  ORF type:complete len:539 (-),score=130.68 GAFH01001251.1:113-1729(-)